MITSHTGRVAAKGERMFGIGFQEMLIILVVVLIVFGPKRLPDLAKSIGKGIAEFKKASDEVRKGIEEAAREAEEPQAGPGEAAVSATPEARALESYSSGSSPEEAQPAEAPPGDGNGGEARRAEPEAPAAGADPAASRGGTGTGVR